MRAALVVIALGLSACSLIVDSGNPGGDNSVEDMRDAASGQIVDLLGSDLRGGVDAASICPASGRDFLCNGQPPVCCGGAAGCVLQTANNCCLAAGGACGSSTLTCCGTLACKSGMCRQ